MTDKERPCSTGDVVSATLVGLRAIRSKAESSLERNRLLADAEILAKSGTDYLLNILKGGDYAERENGFPIFRQSVLTQLLETYFVVSKSGLVAIDTLTPHDCNLSSKDLFDTKLLVLAPLSTDYLMLSFIQRCTQEFLHPLSFSLKPIILSERTPGCPLKVLAVPDFKDQSFSDIERIGVFVDSSGSGRTISAMEKIAGEFHKDLMALRKAA